MKIVELEIDIKARSSFEIIKKINQINTKAKYTIVFYMVVIIVFTLAHGVVGIIWITSADDNKPCNLDLAVGTMNVIFFVPFDLLKMYLSI